MVTKEEEFLALVPGLQKMKVCEDFRLVLGPYAGCFACVGKLAIGGFSRREICLDEKVGNRDTVRC